jgi:polyhydroxybutyrate depolymerase
MATGGNGGSGGTGGSAAGGSTARGGTTGSGGSVATGGSKATGGESGFGGRTAVEVGGSTSVGGTGAGGVGENGGAVSGGSSGSGGSGPRPDGGRPDSAAGGSSMGGTGPGGAGGGSGGSSGTVTCPTPALKSGDTNKTVKVGSDSRTYILHVPSKYDGTKPVPFVVDFHPIGGSGSGEEGSSPYKALTDAEGVITAYPNGKSGPMGGAWNVGPCCVKDVDDVAFARALVEDVEKVACIDTKRVYAVGFSMGGGMSHYVACHAADVFAAVAPAAFDLLKENQDGCKPTRPITVISFRSTGDSVVAYDGGYSNVVSGMPITFLGAKGTFSKWAEINQCTGSPSAEDSSGCSTYSSCGAGVQVTLCTKKGGSHEAGNASVGWPLLKKYTMP